MQPSHPLSPLSAPAFNLSQHQSLFQWVSSLHQVPKYWSFSFSISTSNEYSELIFFMLTDLISLVSKGLSKVFFSTTIQKHQFYSAVFFMDQLSHPYMTTGKYIALTIQIFVSKVMSLFFNTLPRFVIVFLPRSKHLLISWLWSLYAVILEPKKIKSVTVFIFSPSICHEVMGPDAMIFVFWMLSFKSAFHSPL